MLLLTIVCDEGRDGVGLDRLAYYDFFADAPFLVFGDDTAQRRQLVLAGFSKTNLSYHSAAQRFANRRARLQHDLSLLAARGLIAPRQASGRVTWVTTDDGTRVAGQLRSMYALAFRESAALVVTKLNKLSDGALERDARRWLKAEPFLIDLVLDAEVAW
ncbi:MAG TPA: ABC-three component system middle component 2 [Baekduia sp.]|nr:ABC-three component system middle component 2 [Baekduia sp.]